MQIDEAELDRAVANVAAQNQHHAGRSCASGCAAMASTYARFRANLRDQMLVERVREREVAAAHPHHRRRDRRAASSSSAAAAQATAELNIAQILVTVPEGASDDGGGRAARARRRRRWRACSGGEPTSPPWRARCRRTATAPTAARSACARPTACPTCSSKRSQPLKPGEVAPQPLRSGAGFHVLKLVERKRRQARSRRRRRARATSCCGRRPQLTRRTRRAPAGRIQAPDRRRRSARFEDAGARELRGRQRGAGRRPRLGLAGQLRARVRGGDEPRCAPGGDLRRRWCRASACT